MKISGTRMMSLPILLALSVPVGATSYAGITIGDRTGNTY